MKKLEKLFGTAGIRGLFGEKVTADLIVQLSQSMAELYPASGMLVGHDARTSSEVLAQYACASLAIVGKSVFQVGLCSFPVIANLTTASKHEIAIYITASHNAPEYNGVKVLQSGREFTKEEQDKLEEAIQTKLDAKTAIIHKEWHEIIPQQKIYDADRRYIRRIKNYLQFEGDGRTIIIDPANGPMGLLSPILFSELGFKVISINSHVDGSFPGRPGEPIKENLQQLIGLCKLENAIGIAHDGDGDRVSIIDEAGSFIELSRINALLAKLAIEEEGEGNVILSIDSSTCIDNVVKLTNSKVIRTNLGELHGKALAMIAKGERVIFAAEPWKPIHPKWGLWIDGLFSIANILKVISTKKTTVSELMKEIPKNIAERRAYLVDEKKQEEKYNQCKETLEKILKDEQKKELTIDGLRYDMEDGTWILIRKSGTEPKIRLYFESPTQERYNWIKSIIEEIEKKVLLGKE